ncbi:MAG: indole-3-glycerol phosphate synthase TrpC [Calditrichaeota bacterium]|nr:indole-3-glycerol phosphate synthase TrpC [Calditrichota bacterium]
MHNKLKEIYQVKSEEVKSIDLTVYKERIFDLYSFKSSVQSNDGLSLIAEIKKASPSRGVIRKNFNINTIIQDYKELNAQAISVLTDQSFFQGSPEYLQSVKKNMNKPVLRKDFMIDEKQIEESYLMGADIVLLIVAMLDTKMLKALFKRASSFGLDVLVETHTKDEISLALDCGAEIVGINNRDLNTFEVNIHTGIELVDSIPANIIKVAESGIHTNADINQIKQAGFDAVLIGEAFMKNTDISAVYNELFGNDTN